MARVTGYKVRLQAFLPAEPFNAQQLLDAQMSIEALRACLEERGFTSITLDAEPGSKRVPDKARSPPPAETQKEAGSQAAGDGEPKLILEESGFPKIFTSVEGGNADPFAPSQFLDRRGK